MPQSARPNWIGRAVRQFPGSKAYNSLYRSHEDYPDSTDYRVARNKRSIGEGGGEVRLLEDSQTSVCKHQHYIISIESLFKAILRNELLFPANYAIC